MRLNTTLPAVWPLIELELWFKNESVSRHETKPLVPKIKVLGHLFTYQVRSIMQYRQNCIFIFINISN